MAGNDWVRLRTLLTGSLQGIFVGSHLANHVPELVLRRTLAGMPVLVGAKSMGA